MYQPSCQTRNKTGLPCTRTTVSGTGPGWDLQQVPVFLFFAKLDNYLFLIMIRDCENFCYAFGCDKK